MPRAAAFMQRLVPLCSRRTVSVATIANTRAESALPHCALAVTSLGSGKGSGGMLNMRRFQALRPPGGCRYWNWQKRAGGSSNRQASRPSTRAERTACRQREQTALIAKTSENLSLRCCPFSSSLPSQQYDAMSLTRSSERFAQPQTTFEEIFAPRPHSRSGLHTSSQRPSSIRPRLITSAMVSLSSFHAGAKSPSCAPLATKNWLLHLPPERRKAKDERIHGPVASHASTTNA
mmetsp:Transcript_7260/g.18612  ORF Transcript_7260/g.18612 Transcript_7260/m.18612 type:complete len:234 (-) Transcript_7260:249-950(-)